MTRNQLSIFGLAALAFAQAAALGCSAGSATDRLTGDESSATGGASSGNLYEHPDTTTTTANQTALNQAADVEQVGSPEVYARLHSCGKLTVHSMARILGSRGVSGGGAAQKLLSEGVTALGAANYGSRAPESVVASTANLTKQFDILVAAAPEMIANAGAATGPCPGVKVYDAGSFTKDGLACLMGKPATADHIFLANQAVKDAVAAGISEDDGKSIAVAALLQAAHTCE